MQGPSTIEADENVTVDLLTVGYKQGASVLKNKIKESIKKHTLEGWNLASVNMINERSTNGTGDPVAFITYMR